MAKYLTKAQVVSDFNLNYKPKINEADYEQVWELLLDSLLSDKRISDKQRKIWKFPK